MNIIVFPRSKGKSYNIQVDRWYHYFIPMALVAAVLVTTSIAGYYLGEQRGQENIVTYWKQDVWQQQEEIKTTRESTEAHIDALAQYLGRLQAHVDRLNALGGRLVEMAKLDETEFNFINPPGLGGPAIPEAQVGANMEDITSALDLLATQLADREHQLKVLDQLMMSRNLHQEVHPAGRPIKKGWISSYYGKRTDPFSGKKEFHRGVDFAGKEGSDVVAVAGGVITWSGRRYGYGNLVEIDHGNRLVTRYGHNKETLLSVGEIVKKGQVIAKMGSTGRSTGPHVHFEVMKNGKHVNPTRYVRVAKN